MGGRLPEIARRLKFPSREKMMGWALTRWRALTRYSTVVVLVVVVVVIVIVIVIVVLVVVVVVVLIVL